MATPAVMVTAGQKIGEPPGATGIQPTFFANQKNPIIAITAPVIWWPFFLFLLQFELCFVIALVVIILPPLLDLFCLAAKLFSQKKLMFVF
jgi:hypothetical protein